ncbi:MAG: hypothetical protein J0I41_03115 [Filimonas sp.]|nr:hypothetical protein [Filimonas sp.]
MSLASPARVQAQEVYNIPDYTVYHYTADNGLPQNSVKSISKDGSGFIWFATEAGLVRYDGRKFVVFNRNNLPLSSSRIVNLHSDVDGTDIYGVNENWQAALIRNGKVVSVESRFSKPFKTVVPLDTPYNREYVMYSGWPSRVDGVDPDSLQINPTQHKGILIIRNKGYVEWLQDGHVVGRVNMKRAVQTFRFFLVGEELYYIEDNNAITRITPQGVVPVTFKSQIKDVKNARLLWKEGADVFLCEGSSIYRIVQEEHNTLRASLITNAFDVFKEVVIAIYYDEPSGNIFLGSYSQGLFVLKPTRFKAYTSGGMTNEVYYGQTPFSEHTVLTGKGVVLGPNTKPTLFKEVQQRTSIFGIDIIRREHEIWTTREHSVTKFASDAKTVLQSYTFTDAVSCLYLDKINTLWAACDDGALYSLPIGKKEWTRFMLTVPSRHLMCMAQESDSILWVGAINGLFRINTVKHTVTAVPELENKIVRGLYVSKEGIAWVTTYEDGYFAWENGKLTTLPLDKNNYLLNAHYILEDRKGFFWIPTNRGLFQLSKQNLLHYLKNKTVPFFFLQYTKNDGFNTNEFNGGSQPCGVILPDHSFSLPSMNGVVMFQPDSIHLLLPDKELMIERPEVDGKLLPMGESVTLPQSFSRLHFQVVTPYFGNPYNLRIEYAIIEEGGTPVWLPLEEDNTITQSALPSGQYTLMVRKPNGFAVESYTTASVALIVPPAFYETFWFKMLIVAAIILLTWLYFHYKIRAVNKRNQMLREMVAERTAELEDQLTMQRRFSAIITHDIRSPLYYLSIAAKSVMKEVPQESSETLRKMQVIESTSRRLYHLTDNLLQYIKVRNLPKLPSSFKLQLYAIVKDKVEIFSGVLAEKKLYLYNEVNPAVELMIAKDYFSIVVHNLLDNAIKFTKTGYIKISTSVLEKHVQLTIEDSGLGMPEDMVNWINNEALHQKNTPEGGMGLVIVKQLVGLMDARIEAERIESGGSKISIYFNS